MARRSYFILSLDIRVMGDTINHTERSSNLCEHYEWFLIKYKSPTETKALIPAFERFRASEAQVQVPDSNEPRSKPAK